MTYLLHGFSGWPRISRFMPTQNCEIESIPFLDGVSDTVEQNRFIVLFFANNNTGGNQICLPQNNLISRIVKKINNFRLFPMKVDTKSFGKLTNRVTNIFVHCNKHVVSSINKLQN
eukprot:TRINITY_DN3416_c0_g3_i4.p1 TRINITY_DN3416_c0_g3~~TRINITY_DN3416_c0_g3_i4.p1  ORF type:complete len:116 (-),score=18.42 TRINITY_DN3416_c0_g3_i4:375-722(-)